jgi:DNA-binding MarR family transcriptional regulator
MTLWLGSLGVGLGTWIPANNSSAMTAVPLQQAAAAGGMVNMARGLGTAHGGGTRRTGGDVRADGLAEGIARLRRALRRGARVASPGNSLAVAHLELLSALAEHPGTRPGQLARQLHMRPNTVTTIVNALAAQGMISRSGTDGDRRAVELTITDAGQQAVHAWQATNAAVLHLALSTLPASQRRALATAVPALEALAEAIDRLADTAS